MVIALRHLLDHPSLATHPTRTESQRSRMVGPGTGSRMINIVIAKLVTLNSKRILSRLHADRRWRRQYAREVLTTRITMVKERKPVPCCGSRETFVRPRYHQGPWWVQVRESLGPEDDAFRSGHRNGEDDESSRMIRWPSTWLVHRVRLRHLLTPLSDFDLDDVQQRRIP